METVLSVEGLCKSYGDKRVVVDLSFTIKKGEIFGLLGPNGAGKSTTIECILGTKIADSGKVSVLGSNIQKHRKDLFERIGVQFQESNVQDKITVYELCEVTQSLYKKPADFKGLLKTFGLIDKVKQYVSELSGGERQRLFIVLALIPNPELVFLDEITTGLDSKARRDVWRYLESLKKEGLTVLLTSHYMDEVEALCDKICILKKGQMGFNGTIMEAIEQSPYDNLEEAYLWIAGEEEIYHESL